ncbi:MAG: response regulator [Anaerolineae bacterium]|nr:response regulator [Anaerolineae bacterium]
MEKMGLEAAIPLVHLGNVVGIYFLRGKISSNPFTISELNVLAELDEWAGTAIYNTWVVSEKEDYSRALELEMEQQSKELSRVVDETRKFRRSTRERTLQHDSVLGQAHQELREPLDGILSTTTTLIKEDKPSNDDMLEKISKNSKVLAERIDTFLDYLSLQTGEYHPQIVQCDLVKLFTGIIDSLQKEYPHITEILSFHLAANTPVIINLDLARLKQILVYLIQITLHHFQQQAFVINCGVDSTETPTLDGTVQLSFLCEAKPDAIQLHHTQVQIDQPSLKLELIQLLLRRLDGELRRTPTEDSGELPFHFILRAECPSDTYPAYLAVDLPFLKGKTLIIYDVEQSRLKQMTLHAASWGMHVIGVAGAEELENVIDTEAKPDLIMINGNNPVEKTKRLEDSIRTILYHTTDDPDENHSSRELTPDTMYNLVTRALLFSVTTQQYPQLPRGLKLPAASKMQGKKVTVVRESDNLNIITHYLSRFQLETNQYDGNISDLPRYQAEHPADILIFELATDQQDGITVLRAIREQKDKHPFIIATSSNPNRFPALEVIQAGANKYLLKPYALEELLTMVADWLNQSASE